MAKETKEGNGDRSLLYLPDMSKGAPIEAIEEMMTSLLEPDKECFLVEIRIKPTNNIKVFLDADRGISIDKCVTYNRALYKRIEESGLFPSNDFSLELSSPGLDEPLKLRRQYVKNIGRNVEVTTKDGIMKSGKLQEVGEDGITIQETRGTGKKQEFNQHDFLFDNIKTTKVQIQF
jgi:ribosome maturation factor RimP